MNQESATPALRFKGFEETWKERKLGEVAQVTMGQSPDGSTYSNKPGGSILVQGNADIKNGWVDPRVWTTQITKQADAGDLIMSVRAPAGAMGKTAYDVVIGRGVAAIQGNEFLYQLLVKRDIDGLWKQVSSGSTFDALNAENIKSTDIYIPSTDEQNKIGAYLEKLDQLISLQAQKLDKLEDFKKAMLNKMFPQKGSRVPEIRFQGFTEPWEERKLGEIGKTYSGLSGKIKTDFGHGEARYITYMNVFSCPVSSPTMIEPIEIDAKQNEVEVGDVFFTTSSETPEEVGMSSVLLEKQGHLYLNSFCFGYRPSIQINNLYLAYMLRSTSMREQITLLAQGISRYNISKNKVMELFILLPALEEQYLLGQCFSLLDRLLSLHRQKLEKLQAIKKAMLGQMFPPERAAKSASTLLTPALDQDTL